MFAPPQPSPAGSGIAYEELLKSSVAKAKLM